MIGYLSTVILGVGRAVRRRCCAASLVGIVSVALSVTASTVQAGYWFYGGFDVGEGRDPDTSCERSVNFLCKLARRSAVIDLRYPAFEGDSSAHYRCYTECNGRGDIHLMPLGCGFEPGEHESRCTTPPPPPDPAKAPENRGCPIGPTIGNPCDPATGNKFQKETDITGLVEFRRYYNSFHELSADRSLGPGWTHTYSRRLIAPRETASLGQTTIHATREDGRRERFVQTAPGRYQAANDPTLVLTAITPTHWTVHRSDGRREHYDEFGLLTSLENIVGQHTRVRYTNGVLTGVEGPFGHSLSFEFDAEQRLVVVKDPAGLAIRFSYADGHLTAVTYQDQTTRRYQYSDPRHPHHLTGIVDETGSLYALFSYYADGKVRTTEHANGQQRYTLRYNDELGETEVTDAKGRISTYRFSGLGRLVPSRLDPPGPSSESREYDAEKRLTLTTDERGIRTRSIYDAHHRRTLIEAEGTPFERVTRFDYLSKEHDLPRRITRPSVFAEEEAVTELAYAPGTRQLTRITQRGYSPDGRALPERTVRVEYNVDGNIQLIDGPRGANDIVTMTYYSAADCAPPPSHCGQRGQLKTIRDASGNVTQFDRYDQHGRVTQRTAPNGLVTQLRYDARGRLEATTLLPDDGEPLTTRTRYRPNGTVAAVEYPDGSAEFFAYNAANERVRQLDRLGNRKEFRFNKLGQKNGEFTHDEAGQLRRSIELSFDERDRLSATQAANSLTRFLYDAVGNLTHRISPRAHTTVHSYDPLSRLATVTDALSGKTQYEHDVHDQVISVTDPLGRVTDRLFDDFGNLLELRSPDTGIQTYTHDLAGNVLSKFDARGVLSRLDYDAQGRLRIRDYPQPPPDGVLPTPPTKLEYDDPAVNGQGLRTEMRDESGHTRYAYDQRGNLTGKSQTIGERTLHLGYTYDKHNRLSTITYPSGAVVRYERDLAGQVIRVTRTSKGEVQVLATDIEYEPMGPPKRWQLGTADFSLTVEHQYDLQYRLRHIRAGNIFERSLEYDADSNLERINDHIDPTRSQTFTYDSASRLDTATSDVYGHRDYDHDLLGNRRNVEFSGIPDGLIPTAPDRRFHYGQDNRLKRITQGGHTVAEYRHNGDGERVEKRVDGKTFSYVYSNWGALLSEDISDGSTVEYVYLNGVPLAQIGANTTSFYLNDQLGTPQRLIDAQGRVAWDADYTPFGARLPRVGTVDGSSPHIKNNLRYPGQYFDEESGLQYNYQRVYDPELGQYLKSDPLGLIAGLNTYIYAFGNPLKFSDPSGLLAIDCLSLEGDAMLSCLFHWEFGKEETILRRMEQKAYAIVGCIACEAECLLPVLTSDMVAQGMAEDMDKAKQAARSSAQAGRLGNTIKMFRLLSGAGTAAGVINCTITCREVCLICD